MLKLLLRFAEFTFYRVLITAADQVSKLPREMEPDALRMYRQSIALKAQIEALEQELKVLRGDRKPKVSLATRAAQVFAYLLTQGDENFQRYFLSTTITTIQTWLSRFRTGNRRHGKRERGGRPATHEEIVFLILLFKEENPAWGYLRIRQELLKMGIRLAKETVRRILHENGYPAHPDKKQCQPFAAAAVDALWAMDFFVVRTARKTWAQVLLVIDVYSRELLALEVHDGWDVDSTWTARTMNHLFFQTGRKPEAVLHDGGSHFKGQFTRLLRVEDVEQKVGMPCLGHNNIYAERHIMTVRRELLRHLPPSDASRLQWFLNEFRRFANNVRPHQGIEGLTPKEKGKETPRGEVLTLAELRARKVKRESFAHGLLNSYSLDLGDQLPRDKAA